MQPAKLSYKIYQGSTFQEAYRWESKTKVYTPIQSISKTAPCVITTTQDHEMPVGWRFRVVGAGGMKEINSAVDSFYLSTGSTSSNVTLIDTVPLQDAWIDQRDLWEINREQDAQTVAPVVRPWAGMSPQNAYTALMNSQNLNPPAPSNFAPILNTAIQAYNTWQSAIATNQATIAAAQAAQARIIEINEVNSLQYTTYTNGGIVEYYQPVDISTYKARMQVRKTVNSPDVIYEASSDTGEIAIDLMYSTITITIPATVTQSFDFTTAVYAVELYDTYGKVIPFLTGNLTLVQEITR